MNFSPFVLSLRQLQYVVAVEKFKSFRRAAQECNVAQPSLSAQIALAEKVLGVLLFERDKHRVFVTEAGRVLSEKARQILLSCEDLVFLAEGFSDPFSGLRRLGIIPTVGPYVLPELAPRLREFYPRLSFQWLEEKTDVLVKQLQDGELDAAVLALESDLGNLEYEVLLKDNFVFAAAPHHVLAQTTGQLNPRDLDGQNVFLLSDGHCFHNQVLSYCSKKSKAEYGLRATSLGTLVQMVAGGAGVTLLPTIALRVENRQAELFLRELEPEAPYRTLALVWRPSSPLTSALRNLGETMRKVLASN